MTKAGLHPLCDLLTLLEFSMKAVVFVEKQSSITIMWNTLGLNNIFYSLKDAMI